MCFACFSTLALAGSNVEFVFLPLDAFGVSCGLVGAEAAIVPGSLVFGNWVATGFGRPVIWCLVFVVS